MNTYYTNIHIEPFVWIPSYFFGLAFGYHFEYNNYLFEEKEKYLKIFMKLMIIMISTYFILFIYDMMYVAILAKYSIVHITYPLIVIILIHKKYIKNVKKVHFSSFKILRSLIPISYFLHPILINILDTFFSSYFKNSNEYSVVKNTLIVFYLFIFNFFSSFVVKILMDIITNYIFL